MRMIYIAVFGLIGIFFRYYLHTIIPKYLVSPFPYSTFLINIVGAFTIGAVYIMATERVVFSSDLKLGIMVGLLGGFTTFSSFCLDTVELIEHAEYLNAFLYVFLSNVLGFGATFFAITLMRT
ncbi:MAG: hypothetical protein A2Z20_11040 [Bdellovibrionales bacterium RBG_16_40_8]|nr:MAG: hypothetical protein A2Z20_11040 [Bdellovibrionales bacterium RBG_16_40_8]